MADRRDLERIEDDVRKLQIQAAAADTVVERLDTTLDKITELSTSIQTMLVVHERRFEDAERQHETISRQNHRRAEAADKELNILHKRISALEDKLDSRLRKIEIWQWIIVGGATVVGFFLSRFFPIDLLK